MKLDKNPRLISKVLRTSAHGKTCVLCGSEDSSMPCHLPHSAIGFAAGIGEKTHDWLTADCCMECHWKLDHGEWRNDFMIRMRALTCTIQRRINEGKLIIEGEKHAISETELPF